VLDYYEEDSSGYRNKASLEWNSIELIYCSIRIGIVVQILENYQNNIQLITYFLEDKEKCESLFNTKIEEILKVLSGERHRRYLYGRRALLSEQRLDR